MGKIFKDFAKKYKTLIFFSTILIILFSQLYFSQIKKVSFHSDEMLWPCMGNIFRYLIHGDWTSKQWKITPYDFTNGPVPRYLYGLGVSLSPNAEFKNFQKTCSKTWSSYVGKKMSDLNDKELAFLFYVRTVNIVVALLVLWLLFIFLYLHFDILSALLGTLLLGLNNLFATYAVRAMAEMLLVFFIIASQLILLFILNKIDKHKPYLKWLILFGATCAMAIMTKPYGIMCIIPLIAVFFSKHAKKNEKIKIVVIAFVSIAIATILTYPPFLLNPFNIVRWFVEWTKIQNDFQYYYPDAALHDPLTRLIAVFQYLIYPGTLSNFGNLPLVNVIILIIFLLNIIYKGMNKTLSSKDVLTIMILFGFSTFGSLYLYRTWDRYFVPLLLSYTILYSYLFSSGLKLFKSRIKKNLMAN